MARTLAIIVAFGMLVAAAYVLNDYHIYLLSQICLAGIVALGLVLMSGVAGLASFSQAAFVGIAAYAASVATVSFGLSPWLGLGIALVMVALVALLAGVVTVGLSGHYLPLCTLAWALSIYNIFGNVQGLGRFEGIGNIPPLTIFGKAVQGPLAPLLTGSLFLGLLMLSWNLLDSRIGRALRTLSLGRQMPECMGIATGRLRLAIFVLAALFAALAGWLYAHIQRFVNPTPFGLDSGVEYMFMALLGGASSLWGALVGSFLLTAAKEGLRQTLPDLFAHAGDFDIVIFSAGLILLMQWAPRGVTAWWTERWMKARRQRPGRAIEHGAAERLPRRALPERGSAVLAVEGVGKRFGGLVANDNISLTLHAGEVLAVIGPNGAGKSTLFNLLSGVDRADSGTISLAGERVERRSARDIAGLGLARTFQHVKLPAGISVLENIAVGAHRRGHAGWLRAMLRLNGGEEQSLLAEAARQGKACGLGERLLEQAGGLPLGLQRIVEVARALAGDPAALLLDEPAAGLRAGEKESLSRLIVDLRAKGLAILVVEHDMDFVMNLADRIVVINFGRVLAVGTPQEIQNNPDVLQAYLGVDA
ncbi:branched-chain amino acid transport system permease protein [Nitrobacteraceae bacterium AZCC 2146]